MEGENEEKGQSIESGITFTQAETVTQSCGKDNDESQRLQEPGEEDQADGGNFDGDGEPSQEADDHCSSAEVLPGSPLVATDTQDDSGCLPSSSLQTEEELSPTSVLSYPSKTQNRPPEPCWYCLRSLDSEYRPETTKEASAFLGQQDDSDHSSQLPSSGQKVSYQTDPRPHFGVAWSSHSPCHPLWGSEGPCWGQRNQEVHYQTHTCPHCHLDLPPDTLRWHELVCGSSWATLASSCPDLKVKLSVNQIINLARILLPEIPLSEYCMSAFYLPNNVWSPKPLLSDILPQYRHSLQRLNLDLMNLTHSLDEELLELVKVCERLEKLSICSFLKIRTVARLLDWRITQRGSLNEIEVRICTFEDSEEELEKEELEEMLSSNLDLPPDLCFSVRFQPFE